MMRNRMTADSAYWFSRTMEAEARNLQQCNDANEGPPDDRRDADELERPVCFGPTSNYETAIATFKQAALWYREISVRGYGVEPWSEDRC